MKKPLIKGVVCVFLLLVFMQSMSQNAAIYKSIRLDTTKVISMEQMVKIATRFYDRHYKSIYDAKEKIFVDENIRKLDAGGADQYHLAQGLSSSSVLLTGTGQSLHISLVFSAKAVIAFPKDTLIVNNFGAVLRMLDSVKTSLPVLLYAKSLYPGAPVILTNLGNTLFELNDDRSAENFYTQSLKINPDFALARHGLVNVYLKRKDFQKALEELYKGVSGMYSQSLHEAHDKLKANEKYHPPREPVGDNPETQASGANSNAPDPNAQIENLHFPKFPDWDNITTFLKDKTIGNIIKTTTHGMDVSIDNKLGEFADLANMTPEQQAAWAENFKKRWNEKENTPGKILYKKNFFCMDLLAAYFENELKEENKRYLTSDSLNNAKFHASLEKIRESDRKAMEQMKGDMPQIQAFMIESCHRITELVDETYDGWRVNAAERA